MSPPTVCAFLHAQLHLLEFLKGFHQNPLSGSRGVPLTRNVDRQDDMGISIHPKQKKETQVTVSNLFQHSSVHFTKPLNNSI